MWCCFREPEPEKSFDLSSVNYEDTVPFALPLENCAVKVVKVYDGDTITVAFHFCGTLYRTHVRLLGIDAPEIKGSSEEEKAHALVAREELSKLVMGKIVVLRKTEKNTGGSKKKEKFGRVLAAIYLGDLDVNTYMLNHGLALPYDGEKKAPYNRSAYAKLKKMP
jgi:micrococcal nuclease